MLWSNSELLGYMPELGLNLVFRSLLDVMQPPANRSINAKIQALEDLELPSDLPLTYR